MDGLEFNKICMALLLVGTATLGGQILSSEILYKPRKPAKPGYEVAVSAPAAGGPAAAAPAKPIAEIMAAANAANGPAVFRQQCATCHIVQKGGPNGPAGPNLYGIVGRNHAGAAGFNYSAAMRAKASEPWTFETLNEFLTNPRRAVPGTTMSFAGIRSDQQRADLLAYLREQADSPVDLPQPQ